MDYPNDWPKPCPPLDAGSCSGAIYRLTAGTPPAASDFLSFYALGKCGEANCKGRGLSVFRQVEHAVHCASLFPANDWKCVAEGQMSPADGAISASDSNSNGHRTYWPASGVTPQLLAERFLVVAHV